MANLRRSSTVTYTNGSYVSPGNAYKVNVYPVGAIASGTNTVNSIPVFAGHAFVAGHYVMKGLTTTSISRVASVDATHIVLDDTIVSAKDDVFINLGLDTGPVHPTFIQTSAVVPIYSTPDTTTAITSPVPAQVTCDANGNYGYWYPADILVWELIMNSSGTPVAYNLAPASTLLTANLTAPLDEAIARYDGVTGLAIQSNYTVNSPVTAPTIDDNGGITARGTHTFGRVGATTTLGGALTVAEAVTIASGKVLTAPGANSLGATGNTNTVNGALTVTQNFTANGTTNTIAGTSLAITSTNTTLLKTDASLLSVQGGTIPSSTITLSAGWGAGPAGSAIIATGGKDNRFTVDVTAGGGTFAANPTVTITFGTAFAVAPQGVVVMNKLTSTTPYYTSWTTTTTGMVITMYGTPTAGHFYFSVILLG